MAYTAQIGAAFNVEGSFNDFFITQVTAKGVPDFMTAIMQQAYPTALVNEDYPNKPLTFPSFSITHQGSDVKTEFQGRNLNNGWRGAERMGYAEINCWISYDRASGDHMAQMRQMRDMAARVFATGAAIAILDVNGNPTGNPTGNGTIVRVQPIRDVPVPQDPNPDVMRRRLMVNYFWMERATAA